MAKSWHQNFKRARKSDRTDTDGTVFDSKGELRRWKVLQRALLAKEIRNLRRQVAYPLVIHDTLMPRPVLTQKGRTMEYTADFVYERLNTYQTAPELNPDLTYTKWEEVIEDFKGYHGRLELLRIAIFEAIYGKKVTITGGKKRG